MLQPDDVQVSGIVRDDEGTPALVVRLHAANDKWFELCSLDEDENAQEPIACLPVKEIPALVKCLQAVGQVSKILR